MILGCAAVVLDPAFLIAVIVALTFWPLTCLWDLWEIPKKRRDKFALLKLRQAEQQSERERSRASRPPKWLIGKRGSTVGTLSPMGQVRIGTKEWEAVSIDGYIGAAERVVVTGRKGRTLEVAHADKDMTA